MTGAPFAEAAVDTFARALGLLGVISGIIGTWIALLAYRRDRSKLKLTWQASDIIPELEVTVVNDGRQPVALRSVQIADWRPPLWVRLWPIVRPFRWIVRALRGNLDYGQLSLDPTDPLHEPRVLAPGQPYVCFFESPKIVTHANASKKLWIVATDALGKEEREEIPRRLLEILRVSARGR